MPWCCLLDAIQTNLFPNVVLPVPLEDACRIAFNALLVINRLLLILDHPGGFLQRNPHVAAVAAALVDALHNDELRAGGQEHLGLPGDGAKGRNVAAYYHNIGVRNAKAYTCKQQLRYKWLF